jgi:hypothetical protein
MDELLALHFSRFYTWKQLSRRNEQVAGLSREPRYMGALGPVQCLNVGDYENE